MDSGSGKYEHFLPLEDWVALLSTVSALTDCEYVTRKQGILRTVGIAKSLVDRLLRGAEAIDGEEILPIEAEDISLENFVVVPAAEGSNPVNPGHVLASATTDKLCTEEIKDIIEKCDRVDFYFPHLRRKGAIKSDALLQTEYFRRLGHLFFRLFVPASSNGRSARGMTLDNSSATDDPSDEEKDDRDGTHLDEEEPGSGKGRRKHAIMDTCKTFKRVNLSDVEDELEQHLLPKPICRLVKDLIESDNAKSKKEAFETMNDVSMELSQMIQDPSLYLYCENIKTDGLNFKDDLLCGRNEELVELLNAIAVGRVESRSFNNSIVLIGGEPGVGKSHLLQNVDRAVTRNGWDTLRAKFDRLSQNQSCSTISSIFDGFIQNIATLRSQIEDEISLESEEEVLGLVSSIENHLNATGIVTLSTVIPSLRALFPELFRRVVEDYESDDDTTSSQLSGPRRLNQNSINDESESDNEEDCLAADTFKHRLHYLFKRLVHAISSPERPMLLVLEDLQWADDASLELISSLVVGSRHIQLMGDAEDEGPSCLIIAGTYRSNEMDAKVFLKRYSASDTVRVTHINLDGMKLAGTHAMVSYALQIPFRLTRELAAVVQTKTLGNPLFVKEFLNSLVAENFLHYSIAESRWQWDVETVKSRSVDDNVAEIMTRKVLQLPEHQQRSLSIISCFGMQVEESTLRLLSSSDEFSELIPSLEEVITSAMIQKIGTSFIFQHDLIQQVVYELINPNELEELHYKIGIKLLQVVSNLNDPSIGNLRLVAIDQINVATSIDTEDSTMKTSFAQLNLIASQHLIELAKPSLAFLYIKHGLRHLGADRWDSNFELCLKLHDLGCLASYLNGAPSQVHSFVGEIFSNTNALMNRMKSFYVLIRTLGTSGKPEVAVDKAFHVLELLGENLPDEVSPAAMQAAVFSTKSLLQEYSVDQLLSSLPRLKDEKKQWTMMMLAVILPYVYTVCPSHLPIISCRMVDISLQSGLCKESAFGFIHLGQILIEFGEIEEAYQWTKVSSMIIQMFKAKSLYPKFKCLVNACISFWVEPLQSTATSLSETYNEALLVGDVEYAVLGSVMSFMQHFLCGQVLSDMEREMDAMVPEMEHFNQLHNIFAHTSMQKAVFALTGTRKDPFSVSQMPFRNEDEVIIQFESSRPSLLQMIYFNQIYTEIFFCNFDVVAKICKKYQSIAEQRARFQDIFVVFFQGLAAFHLSRSEDDSSNWLAMGEECLNQFCSWLKYSEWNFENKVLLLEAEMHFSKGEHDAAEKKYQAAIESARRHRFVHEQGLSSEFLGMFYKSRCEEEMERKSMKHAAECYALWGAHGLLAESRFQFFKKKDNSRNK